MYRGFVFAQDSITDFIRSLEGVNKLAFYSYSRDLSRIVPTHPRPFAQSSTASAKPSPATVPALYNEPASSP